MRAAPETSSRLRAGNPLTVFLAFAALIAGLFVPVAATPDRAVAAAPAVEQTLGSPVKTADLSQFQPGNIISDAVFFNSGTMTEQQIQSFLDARGPACRSGFTCLKNYTDITRSTGADAMCGSYYGGGRESAARIIYKVAQACGVNPQVILVMLQKEQGLVLTSEPSAYSYRAAMGQGCPDTSACDTRYYGFFNQVYGGVWQLKRYGNPPGTSQYFTWYAPGKTWNIRWNPDAGCGSSPVYVQNQATANLYYYTPYQPNAAAIRAGYGEGDGCSSYGNRNFFQFFTDWFGSTQGVSTVDNPVGNFESAAVAPGEFIVSGWTLDPNGSESLAVHVYVGGRGIPIVANVDRPDVGAAYPGKGSAHGFSARIPANADGTVDVCIWAINVGPGTNSSLGCRTLTAMSGSPVGQVDTIQATAGGIKVSGWALDPDTTESIQVHAYVDGKGVPAVADSSRPDLAPHYPAYGGARGYSITVPASAGDRTLCVYAINKGAGSNTTLTCRSITVPGPPDAGALPKGNFESVTVSGNSAVVNGWALDPDTPGSIPVHLYVNGSGVPITANAPRADLAAAFPLFSGNNGFSATVSLPPGRSQICAYAINTSGPNLNMGCRTVETATTGVEMGRAPIGNFESATTDGKSIRVSGWALDLDTVNPIAVHVYVDGVGWAYTADQSRPDVGAAFPGIGDAHGYSVTLPASSGSRNVCVWAIDSVSGKNTSLGCRTVTVP